MTSPPPLFDLSGKTALVTGSSRGLGLVMARALGLAGASVILNGRNAETLNLAAAELQADGIDCRPSVFDVCDEAGIRTAVAEIEKQAGAVEILVNNAGINIRQPLETFSAEDWDGLMDINLKGAFLVSKQVAPGMIGRKSGKIINVCSMQSELGRPGITPYAASKGGLKMLTRGMAVEWGKHNIQVNGIGPGYFKTELTRPIRNSTGGFAAARRQTGGAIRKS